MTRTLAVWSEVEELLDLAESHISEGHDLAVSGSAHRVTSEVHAGLGSQILAARHLRDARLELDAISIAELRRPELCPQTISFRHRLRDATMSLIVTSQTQGWLASRTHDSARLDPAHLRVQRAQAAICAIVSSAIGGRIS